MSGKLVVRPDKNEFLLYAMLNALGLVPGDPDSPPIKRRIVNHFRGYEGIGLKQEDYIHHTRPVYYVLTINDAPDFSEKKGLVMQSWVRDEVEVGKVVLPHLKHFYRNTYFEDLWHGIIPSYRAWCEDVYAILSKSKVRELVETELEVDGTFNMEVIPMPLERIYSAMGINMGDTSYHITGAPFGDIILQPIAHQASRAIVRQILEPIVREIYKRHYLLRHIPKQQQDPDFYGLWLYYFEEHFVTAMMAGCIAPSLGVTESIESIFAREEEEAGMVFIRDFYDEIRKHKENPTGSLPEVALRILERLDRKHQAQTS